MKTERLHAIDPLLFSFEAEVIAHAEHRGRPSVVLDRTAFYAEAGGQMADRGTLADRPLVDVQADDEGRVHHVLEGDRPPLGARVHGEIDPRRRREHMSLHTGQHALSRALADELSAVTVSSRLGESACTIDVDRDGLRLEDVRRAQDRVNALVDEDRPIRQFFPTGAELAGLSLRKPPPETDRVRVVVIEGFDATPCGGTHCTHTSQIELVWVSGVERYKGGTRITFAAGPRARRMLLPESAALRSVAGTLGCAPPEVVDKIEGLTRKLAQAREDAGSWRGKLAATWAERLEAEGAIVRGEAAPTSSITAPPSAPFGSVPAIVAFVDGADAALLRSIAERLSTGERVVALACASEGGTHVLVARGPGARVHAGELVRAITRAGGGRGGGRAELAEGRLDAGVDWRSLALDALR